MDFYRDTWVEINLDAISRNVERLRTYLPSTTEIMAVVKANGYGHGAEEVATTALEAGATWLSVAFLDEAIRLRKSGIKAPILVLGYTRPEDLGVASEHNISLTVFQKEWVEAARTHYRQNNPVFFHIKIDTGMGRIGVRSKEELKELAASLSSDPRFVIEGVFTHFATADDPKSGYFETQNEHFADYLNFLKELGVNPNLIHCSNSASALRNQSNQYNMVRYGIAMYGLSPSPDLKPALPFQLEEAFALYSRLVHVKKVETGESIGYGASFKTEKETWVGTVPIGYADGWLRKLTGSSLIINNERMPIIGRICMDQLMVELTHPFPVGEKVTLIGESLPVDEVAERLGTINYEVTCMINERVPRIYFKGGKRVKVNNDILSSLESHS